jgi:hypothetical protein
LLVLTRNRPAGVQAVALTSLGVLLAAAALTVSTLTVLSL